MFRKTHLRSFAVCLALAAIGDKAYAVGSKSLFGYDLPDDYDRGNNIAVTDRAHPEFDPLTYPVGPLNLLPTLSGTVGYTDNLYVTPGDKTSSAIEDVRAGLQLESDFARNWVKLDAQTDYRAFSANSSINEFGGHVISDWRLDINDETTLGGYVGIERTFVERQAVSLYPAGGIGALSDDTAQIGFYGTAQFERIRLAAAAGYQIFNYGSVDLLGGGRYDLKFYDYNLQHYTARAEYGLTPYAASFVQVFVSAASYPKWSENPALISSPEPPRDSTEVRALIGGNFDVTHLIRGTFGVGYVDRSFNNKVYGSIDGVAMDGAIQYFPTPLTTVNLEVNRSVIQIAVINAGGGGGFENSASLGVNHELLRNLILSASVSYADDRYHDYSREDKVSGINVGASYLINRYLRLSASLDHRDINSTGAFAIPNGVENRALITITVR